MSTIGPAAYHTLGNLVAPKKPSEESYDRLIEVMTGYFNPKPLVTMQRYKFYSRFCQPGESVSSFVAELRSLAKDCAFDGTALEENLRDCLVCGIDDLTIQKRLLSEQELTFKKAFDIAQSHESAKRNIQTLQGSTHHSTEVHKLQQTLSSSPCYRCGQTSHQQNQCRFKEATCHFCGKTGHIKSVCRSRISSSRYSNSSSTIRSPSSSTHPSDRRRPYSSNRRDSYRPSLDRQDRSSASRRYPDTRRSSDVKQITEEPVNSQEYDLFNLPSGSRAPFYVTVSIDNVSLPMEVDTGASFTVISKETYNNLFLSHPLRTSTVKLKTYTGESLRIYGQFTANVQYQDQRFDLLVLVAGDKGPSLLGRDWLYSLRLNWSTMFRLQDQNVSELLQQYSSIFSPGLGTLKDFKAKIYVNKDIKPIFCKARPVQYAIRQQVEAALDKLTNQHILEPVSFSEWATPIVPVLKADRTSIRICGDFKLTVNRVAKLDRYPIPKIDDLFAKLSGGILFSKIDLSQAYQQLELDKDSKQYTVINTHRGLFRFNRLPFGISSAPGIFQRTMESLLCDIPRVIVY